MRAMITEMFLVLSALILRPVAFKYRSKSEDPAWRARWDWALFVSGLVPALVFGVAVGNVLQGAPFKIDDDLRATYVGGLLGLFTPFTLVCGLLSVAMLVLHGSAWLAVKLHGVLPGLTDDLSALADRYLPAPAAGGTARRAGDARAGPVHARERV